jgi:hypothetical protein
MGNGSRGRKMLWSIVMREVTSNETLSLSHCRYAGRESNITVLSVGALTCCHVSIHAEGSSCETAVMGSRAVRKPVTTLAFMQEGIRSEKLHASVAA